ncbi:MAG TPA: DedA family protein [Lentisphaeria bacterium]|nr:MAG: hypothetical protein A2X48_04120 [Lentisphaerae bacterium GWF2_49_21]HBC85992.1 DedA family protein [Lentisphaeria bacterium]
MTDLIANYIELAARHAHLWGFLLIFIFMAIESSIIPFPSEVVMIPAGFLAFRGELTLGSPLADAAIAVICGILGSMSGAYFNYYLALWLGRPFLHKFGKYFFLPPATLERAEELFREYGDITTFVCRLLPAIRQVISVPAGLSRMNISRFSFFTGLGAGIWVIILTAIGYYLGSLAGDMTYKDLVHKGKDILHHNYIWIIIGLVIIVAVYIPIHNMIMKSPGSKKIQQQS